MSEKQEEDVVPETPEDIIERMRASLEEYKVEQVSRTWPAKVVLKGDQIDL